MILNNVMTESQKQNKEKMTLKDRDAWKQRRIWIQKVINFLLGR